MEAVTVGVLDFFSSVETQVSFTESWTLYYIFYFFLFIYLFICQSLFCGRKWLNITGLVQLCIWVSNKSSKESNEEMPLVLCLEILSWAWWLQLWKCRYTFKTMTKIPMEFHRDLLNLCRSCNYTNSFWGWRGNGRCWLTNRCWDEAKEISRNILPPASFLHGSIMAGGLRAMGLITALGIIQLNVPTNHSLPPPPPWHSLSFLILFTVLNAGGGGGCKVARSERSLGWVFHDPVIWLDVPLLGWGGWRDSKPHCLLDWV